MTDQPRVVLPVLGGGQAASWAALIEIAPMLGDHWLLIGGQTVLLERYVDEIDLSALAAAQLRLLLAPSKD